MNIEHQYLELCKRILSDGVLRENRTGISAYTIPCTMLQHDMSEGFPLLTTRKLPIKSTMVELEGFLRGITSKKWYRERGCKYWDYWANPETVNKTIIKQQNELFKKNTSKSKTKQIIAETTSIENRKNIQLVEDDLGCIYGYQWRKFDEHFGELPTHEVDMYDEVSFEECNGVSIGKDQLRSIINTLKTNPNDRRMLCSAWNPNQLDMMALPPCHFCWGVISINGVLNLWWSQRSCDVCVGIPQNIASYATLLLLLAKTSGQIPGTLTGFLCDTHIYENHIDGIKTQLSRTPRDLPQLEILNKSPFDLNADNLVQWTYDQHKITNYNPHDPIKFEVAV